MNISVIVPTYRRPQLLKRCIDALLSQQTAIHYEIIVVIDGPHEDIERRKGVRVLAMGKNSGPAAARNYGFLHSKGELIVFTDDDCIPGPDFLSAYWNAYVAVGRHGAAFTGKVDVPVSKEPTDYERSISQLASSEFITANCAVCRNSFIRVGGFDETYTMAWREDSDLHFNLLHHRIPIIHVPHAIVGHPVRDAAWNVSLRSERKNMFNPLLYRKFPTYYLERIKSKPPLSYYAIVAVFILTVAAIFLLPYFFIMLALVWTTLVMNFALSRICRSSARRSHVVTMLVTSALIPFLSVYWNTYGNIKFRSWLV